MLGFFFFVILVSKVVALPSIALKGVHWAKDGTKFACTVDRCDVTYTYQVQLGMPFVGAPQCYYRA
jgi:hypothetical protein